MGPYHNSLSFQATHSILEYSKLTIIYCIYESKYLNISDSTTTR